MRNKVVAVSILIPMRNAAAYIEATIQSLLPQSFTDFEIIVVNDGSNDNSQVLVESFNDPRIKIFQGECKGISAALNLALSYAQGDYVCRCDADDLYPVDRLQVQVDWLKVNPEHTAVAGKFSSMDEKGEVIAEFKTGDVACDLTAELLAAKTRTHLGTFLIKHTALKYLNGFREYFVTAEDIDMQLRLAQFGSVGYMPENMYFYRIHNSSITHVQSSNKREFYENIAREFLVQRLCTGQDLLEQGTAPSPPQVDNKATDSIDQLVGYLLGEAWRLHAGGQKKRAIFMGFRACKKRSMDWRVWRSFLMLWVKRIK